MVCRHFVHGTWCTKLLPACATVLLCILTVESAVVYNHLQEVVLLSPVVRLKGRFFYRMADDSLPQWIRTYPEEAAPRTGDGLFPGEVIEVTQVSYFSVHPFELLPLLSTQLHCVLLGALVVCSFFLFSKVVSGSHPHAHYKLYYGVTGSEKPFTCQQVGCAV